MGKGILISSDKYGKFGEKIEIRYRKEEKVFYATVHGKHCESPHQTTLETLIGRTVRENVSVEWTRLLIVEVKGSAWGGREWGVDIETIYVAWHKGVCIQVSECFVDNETTQRDMYNHSTVCTMFPEEVTGPDCFPFHDHRHCMIYDEATCIALSKIEEAHWQLKGKLNDMLSDDDSYKKLTENYSRALTEGNAPAEILLNEEIKNEN